MDFFGIKFKYRVYKVYFGDGRYLLVVRVYDKEFDFGFYWLFKNIYWYKYKNF